MIIRRFLRLSIPQLIAVFIAFCLVAVVRAQAWLNQQAELYQQAELSMDTIDAAPQASNEGIVIAANKTLRSAGGPMPSITFAEVDHTGRAVSSREDIRDTTGNWLRALAAVQPNEPVRSIRSPEPVQRVTPDPMPVEGKKAVTAHVADRSSCCARQMSISDPIDPDTAREQDEVRLTSVTVHRFGAQSTVYRVPNE